MTDTREKCPECNGRGTGGQWGETCLTCGGQGRVPFREWGKEDDEDCIDKTAQPRLRFWLAEFLGEAKTVTGDVWWQEKEQRGALIRRIPLIPIVTKDSPTLTGRQP